MHALNACKVIASVTVQAMMSVQVSFCNLIVYQLFFIDTDTVTDIVNLYDGGSAFSSATSYFGMFLYC